MGHEVSFTEQQIDNVLNTLRAQGIAHKCEKCGKHYHIIHEFIMIDGVNTCMNCYFDIKDETT